MLRQTRIWNTDQDVREFVVEKILEVPEAEAVESGCMYLSEKIKLNKDVTKP